MLGMENVPSEIRNNKIIIKCCVKRLKLFFAFQEIWANFDENYYKSDL